MDRLLWVCFGSALGGGLRYGIQLAAVAALGPSFPFGTLAVNLIGSFLIGLVMHVAIVTTWISPGVRLFLTTGVMGGLTTYSTFNYETLELLRDGAGLLAAASLFATVAGCLAAGLLGLAAGRAWVGG